MQCVVPDTTYATSEYCRRARRIRASFPGSPSLRQHALTQLASQRNRQTRAVSYQPFLTFATATPIQAVERGFTEHALQRLQSFGFTFSDRVDLLNSAEKLGINRFRANMILALHEHRVRQKSPAQQPTAPHRSYSSFLIVLAVEILIVGLIAWVCI